MELCIKVHVLDTPQQNGMGERKNRNLLEVTRSLMMATNVPKQFWGEVILSATYLINRMSPYVLNFNFPYSTLKKSYPTNIIITSIPLKVFDVQLLFTTTTQTANLIPNPSNVFFWGTQVTKRGISVTLLKLKKLYHKMDVTFFENQPYYPKFST